MKSKYSIVFTDDEAQLVGAMAAKLRGNCVYATLLDGKAETLPSFPCQIESAGELGLPAFYNKAFAWPEEALRQYVAVYMASGLMDDDETDVILCRPGVDSALLQRHQEDADICLYICGGDNDAQPPFNASITALAGSIAAVAIRCKPETRRFVAWCLRRMEYSYTSGTIDDFSLQWPLYSFIFGLSVDQQYLRPSAVGASENAHATYNWDSFSNGIRIPSVLRPYYAASYRLRQNAGENPFKAPEVFTTCSVVPGDAPADPPLTAIADAIWLDRPDLQKAFPARRHEGRRTFLEWFVQHAATEYDLEEAFIAPVKQALQNTATVHKPQTKGFLRRSEKAVVPIHPQGVNLCGHIRGEYGIGEATRMLAASLEGAEIPFTVVDIASEQDYSYTSQVWLHKISNRFEYNTNLLYTNADGVAPFLEEISTNALVGRRNIGYWSWELPEFPAEWQPAFAPLDEVWTISEFAAGAIRKATAKPVFVLPHAVQPLPPLEGFSRQDFGLPSTACLVMAMYDARSHTARKNPQAAVEAFLQAFGDDESAGMVLKVSAAEGWAQQDAWLQSLQVYKNIYIIDRFLQRDELNALIQLCDIYISLHRSEGFGFGPAEAMYFGKPAVITNWSGNTEYMRPGACCPVGYELVEIDQDYGPYKKGWYWAQPNVNEAAAYLRRLVSDTTYRDEIAAAGQRVIQTEFSPKAIGERAAGRLRELKLLY